ncbi:hypothetical protein A3F00_05375 [Candidatus Daviesbacteria bacterium RIFCSPHIGHO2_12_FULL_37_11]|uniref:Uncharacterized protein n=1 Tax=Candidatus Daviesbacteria bacterium RIFCSPHIGHO2_12_FULL_37_11 TaxID=1797777 RepID=A0A1F5KCD9_9BACT|nr:MAG: hypothetical protein A2769_00580 [Candidatus Daviesbacteria bacterium RIFCSPHIGHO2_01_FULL_37_27]OGE38480.1 MAG: hypothetical protein A3F00_05375 [Candidatus Daviesbacteria bacterium RIFCSPHIGHO2_12_FULL_37_11]OGE45695.1 MAG: hypothetical protein A3B39_05240 [Candidatus Daviesbacteria bacterium RIFCSPLOWO2_01_FULL_37_10]
MQTEVAKPGKRAINKTTMSLVTLEIAALGTLAISTWEGFINAPETRQSVLQNTPECQGITLEYYPLKTNSGVLLDKYPVIELASKPEFRQPLDCYRVAKEEISNLGLEEGGHRDVAMRLGIGFGLLAAYTSFVGLLSRYMDWSYQGY